MGLAGLAAVLALSTSPARAASTAARDLQGRPAADRKHQRYLSAYHIESKEQQLAWGKALAFWCNSLSKEAELVAPALVAPGLWRVDLRDYGMKASVWDRLEDPYFTATVKTKKWVREWHPAGTLNGVSYQAGYYSTHKTVTQRALAPWLGPRDAVYLAEKTRSVAAIVRADWFLVQTAQQADRNGTGYYDFLGARDRRQFQALVGLDQKLSEKLQKETRAVVSKSGVALHNRQVVRYATVAGAYWTTLDVNNQTGKRNALKNLDGDYQHDAEEIIAALPNGLHAFFLSNAAGVRQDSAPDNIASDHTAPGNDRRVHPGHSCIRCHSSGFQKIDCWARRVYKGPVALASPDYEKAKRLRRLYLSDLDGLIRKDNAAYAEAVWKVSGLKPELMARAYSRLHAAYAEADVTLDDAAREAGVKRGELLASLKANAAALDPALAGLLALPAEPIVREHWEESFPLLMGYIRGGK